MPGSNIALGLLPANFEFLDGSLHKNDFLDGVRSDDIWMAVA